MPEFVDDVAYGWVVAVVGGGEWGSSVVGLFFALEEGSAVNFLGSISLGAGVLPWVTTLAEFVF